MTRLCENKGVIYVLLYLCVTGSAFGTNSRDASDGVTFQPPNVGGRPSAEYYSTIPDAKVLVPVSIWGEVREPGLHFVPMGGSVAQSISAAGGPTSAASLPSIKLIRNSKELTLDLYGEALSKSVKQNDLILIDRSIKSDLPLIFSSVSVVLGVTSFILLVSRR